MARTSGTGDVGSSFFGEPCVADVVLLGCGKFSIVFTAAVVGPPGVTTTLFASALLLVMKPEMALFAAKSFNCATASK